ncbi:hypothetical protein [Oryza sativa Japonica Group]|uniref:Uncharacterized protein n=1 Tax=Oryza sativa subsp. japonica TaxID=39947 RepID=Q5VQU9_ORYSJ|nr:hypothetical protein [Oryza sativa Japonica Group]BAD68176.1 hypothetical protein [Oryza sativa Japonica Group]
MARRELLEVVLCVVVVEPLVLLPQEGKRELERGERVIVDVPGTNGIEAARAWNTCALPHPMDKRQSRFWLVFLIDRSVSVTQENLEPRDQPLSPYGSGMRNGHQSHL